MPGKPSIKPRSTANLRGLRESCLWCGFCSLTGWNWKAWPLRNGPAPLRDVGAHKPSPDLNPAGQKKKRKEKTKEKKRKEKKSQLFDFRAWVGRQVWCHCLAYTMLDWRSRRTLWELLVLLWKLRPSKGQRLCPRGSSKLVTEWSWIRAKVFCYSSNWDRVVKSSYRRHPGHLIHSAFLEQVSWAILWMGRLPRSHRRPWRHSPSDEIKAGLCTSGSGGRRSVLHSWHPPWLGSSEQITSHWTLTLSICKVCISHTSLSCVGDFFTTFHYELL